MKAKDLISHREKTLDSQNGICPLCGNTVLPEEAVQDHDHASGVTRAVLHRSCNMVEGKILSYCKRSRSDNPIDFLQNLIQYWQTDFSQNPEHPSHAAVLLRRFKRLTKPLMEQQLRELQIDFQDQSKAELTKLYQRYLKSR